MDTLSPVEALALSDVIRLSVVADFWVSHPDQIMYVYQALVQCYTAHKATSEPDYQYLPESFKVALVIASRLTFNDLLAVDHHYPDSSHVFWFAVESIAEVLKESKSWTMRL